MAIKNMAASVLTRLKNQQFDMFGGLNEQIIDGMSGFVFQNADGRVPNPQTVNRTIKRIVWRPTIPKSC